ncbi:MAG: IreB family regulatory phosphoprotein [Clostridia bacterium]|nr:IreB family regulatory phosphoprotein [Clostridia bacterium]
MPKNELQRTQTFTLGNDKENSTKTILSTVYTALSEQGYDPVTQIVGDILSVDPTYITNHNNARSLICRIDRYELLNKLLKEYLGV